MSKLIISHYITCKNYHKCPYHNDTLDLRIIDLTDYTAKIFTQLSDIKCKSKYYILYYDFHHQLTMVLEFSMFKRQLYSLMYRQRGMGSNLYRY